MADHVLTFKFGIYISLLFELLVCFDRLHCPWLLAERIFLVSSDENYEFFFCNLNFVALNIQWKCGTIGITLVEIIILLYHENACLHFHKFEFLPPCCFRMQTTDLLVVQKMYLFISLFSCLFCIYNIQQVIFSLQIHPLA